MSGVPGNSGPLFLPSKIQFLFLPHSQFPNPIQSSGIQASTASPVADPRIPVVPPSPKVPRKQLSVLAFLLLLLYHLHTAVFTRREFHV